MDIVHELRFWTERKFVAQFLTYQNYIYFISPYHLLLTKTDHSYIDVVDWQMIQQVPIHILVLQWKHVF
jgi:hypothetical protein